MVMSIIVWLKIQKNMILLNDIDDADDEKEEEDVDEFVCLSVCWVRGEH